MPKTPGLLDEVKIDLTGVIPQKNPQEVPTENAPRMSLTARRQVGEFNMDAARAAKLGGAYTPPPPSQDEETSVRPTRATSAQQDDLVSDPLSSDDQFVGNLLSEEEPTRPRLTPQNLSNLAGRAMARAAVKPATVPPPPPKEEIKEPTPEEMAESAAQLESLLAEMGDSSTQVQPSAPVDEPPAPIDETPSTVPTQETILDDSNFVDDTHTELDVVVDTKVSVPVFYEFFVTNAGLQSALKESFPDHTVHLAKEGQESGAIYIQTHQAPQGHRQPLQLFFCGITAILEDGSSYLANEFSLGAPDSSFHRFLVKV